MDENKTRRRYTKEFKIEAIELVKSRPGRVSEVAENLGIHPMMLYRWIREYSDEPQYAFPGQGKLKLPDEELSRLLKENKDLKEERDILKKALAIFSKPRS
jgi:transposase